MTINTGIPNLLNPGFYFSLDASNANTASPVNRVVILGEATTTVDLAPVIGTSVAEMKTLFGAASTLATAYERYRQTDLVNEVYLMPVVVTGGVPAAAASLTALGDMPVSLFVSPYSDATSIAAYETFLNETTGRWSATQQSFGIVLTAKIAAEAALVTYSATLNSKFVSVLGVPSSTDAVHLIAASYGAVCALSLSSDPELTLGDLQMTFAAPVMADRFDFTARETLLQNGISTFTVTDSGVPVLSRAVTLYRKDNEDNPDNSYQDVETMTGLAYVIQRLKAVYTSKMTRKKLVDQDALVVGGTNFITANTALGLFIAEYRTMSLSGLVQDPDSFAKNARAESAAGGKINMYMPITLADQLRSVNCVFAFGK
jgi:phage tail sheath gpL-like